jgi:hypothetical protein
MDPVLSQLELNIPRLVYLTPIWIRFPSTSRSLKLSGFPDKNFVGISYLFRSWPVHLIILSLRAHIIFPSFQCWNKLGYLQNSCNFPLYNIPIDHLLWCKYEYFPENYVCKSIYLGSCLVLCDYVSKPYNAPSKISVRACVCVSLKRRLDNLL